VENLIQSELVPSRGGRRNKLQLKFKSYCNCLSQPLSIIFNCLGTLDPDFQIEIAGLTSLPATALIL